MEHHLIINPASAGGRTGVRLDEIRRGAEHFLGLQKNNISLTEGPGHATQLTQCALRNGVGSIIAAGGDGTINEVVNGFFEEGKPLTCQPRLGLIPSGSGGDFRKTFSIDNSIEAGFQRIVRNDPVALDIGLLSFPGGKRRYFVNVASAGLSADIGVNANRAKWLKKINGSLAFNWVILSTSVRHRRYPLHLRTPQNPSGRDVDANCVAICNGQYFGSGIRVAPSAEPGDGAFVIVTVEGRSPLGFLKGVSAIKKDDSSSPEGLYRETATWVELASSDANRTVFIETDGEFAGCLPARFEVIPGAARTYR